MKMTVERWAIVRRDDRMRYFSQFAQEVLEHTFDTRRLAREILRDCSAQCYYRVAKVRITVEVLK